MPWRKRLLVLCAALAALALLAAAGALARAGHAGRALLLGGATGAMALAALQALWPAFDVTGRSLRRGSRASRTFALTFDDGPSADTPAVLDALDAAGARATFFVLGEAAARRPDLVREIARRGHEVALHGHTHARLALAGPARIAAELDRCREAVRRAGVEPAPWFRAPHGWKGPFLGRALRARGLTLVAWTRGVWDTERPGAAEVAARAARRPRPGEILLLHDGCGTPGLDPRRDQTAEAIPEIVRRWRAAGYEPVTVGALAASAPRGGPRLAPSHARLAGVAVLAAFAVAAAARVDLRAVLGMLAGAKPSQLALAMVANVVSLAAHAARWRAVVIAPGGRVRYRDALAGLMGGFAAGLALPARGGDVVRSHLLASRGGLSTASVMAASALDYVVGTVALVPAVGAVALAVPLPPWAVRGLAAVAALAAAAAAAAWLLRPERSAHRHPRAAGVVARLRAGLVAVHHPRALLAALGWGAAGWVAEGAIALATLAALGLPASPGTAALAVLAASIASVAAVAPAGAGTFELATALAVSGAGAPRDAALAFALAYHAVHALPVALLGGAVLVHDTLARRAPG